MIEFEEARKLFFSFLIPALVAAFALLLTEGTKYHPLNLRIFISLASLTLISAIVWIWTT
jgi:hypothetical protein